MATFGDRLRFLREEKKMVQKEIGGLLGVSESTVGKYENNQRTPSPEAILKLADFFHVSTDYLLGRTDIRTPYPDRVKNGPFVDDIIKKLEGLIAEIKEEKER